MPNWIEICHESAIPAVLPLKCEVDGAAALLFRLQNGDLRAIEDVCTHDGGELGDGAREGDAIICARHGAKFCLASGAALCAPAYEPTYIFELNQRTDGWVELADTRWD